MEYSNSFWGLGIGNWGWGWGWGWGLGIVDWPNPHILNLKMNKLI